MLRNRIKKLTYWGSIAVIAILFLTAFVSCKQERSNDIVLRQPTHPKTLNPMISNDGNSRRIIDRIFQPLLQVDYFTYELVPVLMTSRPVIEEINDSTIAMKCEIREEAVWDDTGEDITGKDVDFTLRLMKSPGAAVSGVGLYADFIKDIKIDDTNNKKFVLYCKPYMLMETALASIVIMPKHIYDPEHILDDFTVSDLTLKKNELEENSELTRYAKFFNEIDFQKNIVVGSGPYLLDSWDDKQKVTLKRKENWWADSVVDGNSWLKAYPKMLVYKTIPDINTAVSALRAEELDVMQKIDPRKFVEELRKDADFTNKFHHGTPSQFIYSYLGMQMNHPKFEDLRTRQALRYLMDVEEYSDRVFFGLGERVSTFIHPSNTKFINEDIPLHEYNLDKAKALLAAAGWTDSNQDGTLDRIIDNERVDFKIEVLYPQVATTSEEGVLLFKNTCEKAGIKIIPVGMDFKVMLEKLSDGDFEMFLGLWQASIVESDPSQIWHTKYIGNGHNYFGFGNAQSDAILDALVEELSEQKRAKLYKQLQQVIDDEVPCIFMLAVRNRVAVHKRIKEPNFSSLGRGYWEQGFQVEAVQ